MLASLLKTAAPHQTRQPGRFRSTALGGHRGSQVSTSDGHVEAIFLPAMDTRELAITIPIIQTSSYPARPGNAVRPLVDGEPAFRRVCEAIEAATQSIWATVTFMWADFRMPDGRGSALDVLNRAAARGVDVRLIFWRPDGDTDHYKTNAFWGGPEHFKLLETSHSAVRIRWDRAAPGFCQHQKTWLIDSETSFLGGINLNPHSMVAPGHRGEGQNHDVYIELTGPSVIDVHHNFVQRWNEASERHLADGRWGSGDESDLPFPTQAPSPRGDALVQIHTRSNFDQYRAAINAARRSIYIENQQIAVPEIIDCLRQALQRGVEIVAMVPAEGHNTAELLELRTFENFTLAGIAGLGTDGQRKPVWVHSKLMIVDGHWGTVGSCNLHHYSLFGNSELNAAFWDRTTARALLTELLREHLDTDVSGMDDVAALKLFRAIAIENSQRDSDWQGLAFNLPPAATP
jgi:cardiolipin synthase